MATQRLIALPLIVPALWIVWGLYWWIASRGAKAVVRRESNWSRAAHFVPIGLAVALVALPVIPGPLGQRWAMPTGTLFASGVVLLVLGTLLTVWARRALGGNWSGSVTLKAEHEIVRTGPYRWIRHPIYSGLLLAFIGTALARPQWRGIVAVLLVAVAFWRKLRHEERWLEEAFGAEYAEYRRSTWALIPFVF